MSVIVSVLGAATRLHAQAAERWLVVPVFAGDKANGLDPAALSGPIEAELRSAGRPVVPNVTAAESLETRHSSQPAPLGAEELKRLTQRIHTATRHLALGELAEAQRAMEAVHALPGPARDTLNRDRSRARKIFDNCLMAAYLLERSKQHAAAVEQMRVCRHGYPGYRPEGRAYPPEVQALFDEAAREQRERGPSTLRVVTRDRSGCSVRLHGVEVGKSPLQVSELQSGPMRVQVDCEPGIAGRVYPLELKPGDQELAIDPRFDVALHTRAGLWLAYPNDRERETRAAGDAEAIGRIVKVDRVALLWNLPGAIGVDIAVVPAVPRGRELARASYAADSGYARGGASKLASALLAWAGSPAPASSAHPPAGPIRDHTLSRVERPSPPPPPPPPPPATPALTMPPTAASPLPPRRYTEQHATAGAILAILGGASAAVSWALYAARQSKRTVVTEAGDTTSYKNLGVLTLSTAAVGTSLLSLSEYFWLPDHPSVPALAWVAGGFGLSIGVAAVTLSLTEADCKISDDRVACQRFWVDHHFGPLLFMHGLPLLTAPLWYGLRAAFRPANVQLSLGPASGGAPMLQLRGMF